MHIVNSIFNSTMGRKKEIKKEVTGKLMIKIEEVLTELNLPITEKFVITNEKQVKKIAKNIASSKVKAEKHEVQEKIKAETQTEQASKEEKKKEETPVKRKKTDKPAAKRNKTTAKKSKAK